MPCLGTVPTVNGDLDLSLLYPPVVSPRSTRSKVFRFVLATPLIPARLSAMPESAESIFAASANPVGRPQVPKLMSPRLENPR